MRHLLAITASLLVLSASLAMHPAQAETSHDGFSVGPSVSTLGVGGEVGYRFHDKFGVRGKVQGFKIVDGTAETDNDIEYDYSVKLFTAGAVADYYPWAGGLRLSAGAYYNDNRVSVNNNGGSTVDVGGVDVPVVADTVTGRGRYENRISPYLGVGYDGQLGSGFALGFDLGVLYQGDAEVNVDSNNPLVPPVDLFDVREDVRDGMNNLRFYPVVGVNLLYRF